MKNRTILIISIIAIVGAMTAVAIYFVKKYNAANKLTVDIDSAKPDFKLADAIGEIADLTIPVNLTIKIGNFSSMDFRINQIFVEAFTDSGEYIAYPENPLLNPIDIKKNTNGFITLKYNIKLQTLLQQIKGADTIQQAGIKAAQSWFTTGKFGVSFKIKGFIKADNIPVKIDDTVKM